MRVYIYTLVPLSLGRPGPIVVGVTKTWVPVWRRVLIVTMVSSVGQRGYVGVVEVDVRGLGRLAVGVVVAAVVVMVVVMVVVVGHRIGSRQAAHRLLHVGVVRRRLHLQRSLSSVGLVAVGPAMPAVHEMVGEEPAIALRKNGQSKITRLNISPQVLLTFSLQAGFLPRLYEQKEVYKLGS